MRILAAMFLASCWLATSPACAQTSSPLPMLPSLVNMPPARLVGAWPRAGHPIGGTGAGGFLIGVDGGWATTLSVPEHPSHGGFAFGGRVGWEFPNGLALHLRYDDLGVKPDKASAPLQFATAGARYTVPFVIPMPFAEVDLGAAWYGGDPRFGAGATLGIALPLGPFVLIDVGAHDWLTSVAGTLRHTLGANLALTVMFASPAYHS